ncbi:unnamed protein product, partial [Notodromas monacha]
MDNVDYEAVVEELRGNFRSGITRSAAYRKLQLKALGKCLEENEEEFCEALAADLKKNPSETRITEVEFGKNAIRTALFELDSWMKPVYTKKNLLTLMDTVYHYPQPYGVALIIAPWNFPLNLSVIPLVGAIAAGNCAVVKPSEIASNTAAVLAKILPNLLQLFDKLYFNLCFPFVVLQRCYKVICGGVEETSALLKVKFDYIFFTGGAKIGQVVATAASHHLTPVTLELGGKSPLYLDDTVDFDTAVKRILWGKFQNAGQLCLSPDYLMCSEPLAKKFVEKAQTIIADFFGEDPQKSDSFGRIINASHFKRLERLLETGHGKVVVGGITDEADLEHPLSVYVFSKDKNVIKMFAEETSSGSLSVNEVLFHFSVEELPFGGVGSSGFGTYHGKFSFDAFSHRRAVLKKDFNKLVEYVG